MLKRGERKGREAKGKGGILPLTYVPIVALLAERAERGRTASPKLIRSVSLRSAEVWGEAGERRREKVRQNQRNSAPISRHAATSVADKQCMQVI